MRPLVVTLLAVLVASTAAGAQEGGFDNGDVVRVGEIVDDQARIGAETSGSTDGSDGPAPSSPTDEDSSNNDSPRREQAIWLFTVGGQQCWRVVSVTVGTTPVDVPAGTPPCDPADPADPLTPDEWIRTYVETTAPERPSPSFIPPHGITGEPMYLLTEAPITWRHETDETPFGPLTIVGEATVVVDWGDGGDPLRYPVAGEAWPDGQIVNTWTDVGDYDITVTYEWTLDWSFASATGQLPLPHTETLAAYPVIELQPVIRRP